MRASPRPAVSATRAVVGLLSLLALSGAVACSSPTPGPTETVVSPSPTEATAADRAAELVGTLSDEQLVGQVLIPQLTSSDDVATAVAAVGEFQLGGVILLDRWAAADVRARTDALQAAAPVAGGQALPLLISVDQEFGFVNRITDIVQLPAAMAFGAAARPDLAETAWAGVGQELAALGVNVANAPVADVIGPAGNTTIGSRSYGSDPAAVSAQVTAAVTGLQSAGVAAAVKHFPGHGNTTVDSHTGLPVLTQSRAELDATDLPPFEAGIQAGAQLVMAGHLDVTAVDPGTPASFSSKVLIDLLRGELGFTGVVISDALNMEGAAHGDAAVRAILAGNDLLLMPPSLADAKSSLLEALQSGRLPRERLIESVTRILTLKFTVAEAERPDMSIVDSPEHQAAAAAVAAAATTVLSGPCTGPLVPGPVRITTAQGRGQQATWLAEALTAAGVSVVDSGGSQVHLVGYGDGPGDLAGGAAATVAMDTPYVLASSDSPVKVATYSSTRVAMQALAAVIAGTAPAPGSSPVAVDGLPASACRA